MMHAKSLKLSYAEYHHPVFSHSNLLLPKIILSVYFESFQYFDPQSAGCLPMLLMTCNRVLKGTGIMV
jgi:hypothetical protein